MVLRDDAAVACYGESHLKTPGVLDGLTICHPSRHRLCIIVYARPLGDGKPQQSACAEISL